MPVLTNKEDILAMARQMDATGGRMHEAFFAGLRVATMAPEWALWVISKSYDGGALGEHEYLRTFLAEYPVEEAHE